MVGQTLRLGGVVVVMLCLAGCYTVRQAWHQNNLYNSRRPIDVVIGDETTVPAVRDKLVLTREILDYAKAAGLHTENAYTHYIETGNKRVSYLVQAAHADRLEPITWWFPIVGRVPYLGFFDESDRDKKANDLSQEGYDVYTTGVGAFSSLGWFSDPVFTSMLKRNVEDLAHLYFHELTHRTFWISGSVKFNENLAEYVADDLTPLFLEQTGRGGRIGAYQAVKSDRKKYKAWLKRLRSELERLYEQRHKLSPEILLHDKAQIFHRFTTQEKPTFARADFVGKKDWNNAVVLGASLYEPDLERFSKARNCSGEDSLIEFLTALEQRADNYDDAFLALDSFCG